MAVFDYVSDWTMLLVFVVTFMFVYLNTRRPAWAPPGPRLVPVLGNILSLAGNPLAALDKLRAKYGDVLGIYFGSELAVIVSGYEAIHEILVKRGNEFSWRPETPSSKILIRNRSIVFENGEQWKENRRFIQNVFQKLCFNKHSKGIEEKITEELSFFVDKLKTMDYPTDVENIFNISLANVVFSILHGYRVGYTDKDLLWYLEALAHEFKVFRRNQILADCFPFLRHLPFGPISSYMGENNTNIQFRRHFNKLLLEDHKSYVEGEETCLVHHMITHLEAQEEATWRGLVSDPSRDDYVMLHDLMAGGTETTATTIKWILLHLVRNPHVQEKARQEVIQVLGENDSPAILHRKHMPYLEAVILEGLRIGHVTPLGIPRSVQKDAKFRGYNIPRDTGVLLNIASVLKDPAIYPDPESFKPERFLADDGQTVVVPEEFVPFTKGPRSCIGETIARIQLFLYMATLLQKFEFDCADPGTMPDTQGIFGLTYYPRNYKLKITAR